MKTFNWCGTADIATSEQLLTFNQQFLQSAACHGRDISNASVICCKQQLFYGRYKNRVRNDEVLQRAGLTSLSHLLSSRRISVFGHVALLGDVTPANMALQLHINVSLNRHPDHTWRRPRNKWVDQLRNDSTRPTRDLWRRAVDSGHGGATTRRPSSAT